MGAGEAMNEIGTTTAAASERDLLRPLAWVPLTVSLEASLEGFAVGDLFSFRPGVVVRTTTPQSGTMPVLVNGKLMAWGKLEVIGDRLAARIMELA